MLTSGTPPIPPAKPVNYGREREPAGGGRMGPTLARYHVRSRQAGASVPAGRWEFLVTIAPLPIPNGTGSPVNPIAMF